MSALTLGGYRIVGHLGTGGMGEVYRARDAKLGRDIALKVLRELPTADADRRSRFEREAKTIAALDHPGIVTIQSIEEDRGVTFVAGWADRAGSFQKGHFYRGKDGDMSHEV